MIEEKCETIDFSGKVKMAAKKCPFVSQVWFVLSYSCIVRSRYVILAMIY